MRRFFSIVPVPENGVEDDAWVKQVKHRRMLWRMFGLIGLALIILLELQLGFANQMTILAVFCVAFIVLSVLAISDRLTTSLEIRDHNLLWQPIEDRARLEAEQRKDSQL